jgi:hypothetical protein
MVRKPSKICRTSMLDINQESIEMELCQLSLRIIENA